MPVNPYTYTERMRPDQVREHLPGRLTTTQPLGGYVMATRKVGTSASTPQAPLFDQEEWRAVPGYEGLYEVSNQGRVRSLDRWIQNNKRSGFVRSGRLLTLGRNEDGYLRVRLTMNSSGRLWRVHTLVITAFIGPASGRVGAGGWQVNHIDGNKANNRIDNLEWATHSENAKHAYRMGLVASLRGEGNPAAKLTEDDARCALIRRRDGESVRAIASDLGVSPGHVYNILYRRNWKCIND